jgi:hypothetical protein
MDVARYPHHWQPIIDAAAAIRNGDVSAASRLRPGLARPGRGPGRGLGGWPAHGRGINWLTLRQRGKNQLARLAALPAPEWKTVTIARAGRHASHGWLPRAGVHAGCPFARVRIVVNSSASSSAYAWRCNSAGTYRSSGRSLNHL